MRGVYPEGFPESTEIEKFRVSNPALYEWRKTSHLIPLDMNRPIGRAIPAPSSPAKAGVQSHRSSLSRAAPDLLASRDWAQAFAGEGKRGE